MYGTVEAVKALVPRLKIGVGTGSVTDDEAIAINLTNFSGELDAALQSRDILTPVTMPAWFLTELGGLVVLAAAATALWAHAPGGTGVRGAADAYWAAYQRRLSEIRSGIGIPMAVAGSTVPSQPHGYFVDTDSTDPTLGVTDEWGATIDARSRIRMEQEF